LIPRSFNLVNRKWKVDLLSAEEFRRVTGWDESELPKGACNSCRSHIILNLDANPTLEDLYHTFFHEMFHAILYAEGYTDEHDEAWVERFGGYMAQIRTTEGKHYELKQTKTGPAIKKARGSAAKAVPGHSGSADDRSGEEPGR
jgi:hypothetical protein